MLFTCPECDKKLKLNDNLAGKKMKCPECDAPISVPGKATAIKKGPAAKSPAGPVKKSRKPVDDDDDDADDEPKKKGGMGMILGLVGCAVLLLCLVVPAGGGVGVWYFIFRTPVGDGQQAKKEDGEQKKDDQNPGAKDIKVTLANPKIERSGNTFRMSVDYEISDPKADDTIAVFLFFPSDPNNAPLVKRAGSVEMKAIPKGNWNVPFTPDPQVRGDATCDIVVRLADSTGEFKNGKELAKIAKVPIPAALGESPKVALANVIAKRSADNSQIVDLSFDLGVSGAKPNAIFFVAEFVDQVMGERKRIQLGARQGQFLKAKETITMMAAPVPDNMDVCDLFVSDVPQGNGNLAKQVNVRVQADKPPPADFKLVLSNGKVEADGSPLKLHKVSVDLKLTGTPKNAAYHCAVIFSVKGEKQKPINFGGPALGRTLTDGMKLSGFVNFPDNGDATCDIVVHEVFNEKLGPLAELKGIAISKAVAGADTFVVSLSNAKIERDAGAADRCKVSVDVSAKGAAKPVFYQCFVVFSVKGAKQKPVAFGAGQFAQTLLKGVKVEGINLPIPADADDAGDIFIREALGNMPALAELQGVAVTGTAPVSDKLVVLRNIRVFKHDDFAVQVQFEYEFTKPPDPKRMYTFLIGRKNIKDEQRVCFQLPGDKVQMKGEYDKRISANEFGTAKEYKVWAASGQNFLDANTKESKVHLVKIGAGAPAGKDVTIVKALVERVDDDTVKVSAEYEFANGPVANKNYALVVQRADLPATDPKHEARSASGDKWQKKGQVNAEMAKGPGLGKGKEYRVFMAEGPFNMVNVSNVVTVTVGKVAAGDGNEPIQISAASFTPLGAKKGTRLELSYKFNGDAKPNPKSIYVTIIQVKGGQPGPVAQELGPNFKMENSYNMIRPIFIANQAEVEVWIYDSVENKIVSNKKKMMLK